MEAAFVVVDEDGRRDMHGVHQHQALLDAAFAQAVLNLTV